MSSQIQQIPVIPTHGFFSMDDQNTAIGAIGAVLGYIGAEGATTASFERLFWPQRAHAGLTWREGLRLAVLAPGGGPVYKAALKALDQIFEHGFLRGSGRGHMLGTVFFPQSNASYTLHSTDARFETHTEQARNCLWTRVVMLLPVAREPRVDLPDMEMATQAKRVCRAQVSVHHIILSVQDLQAADRPTLDVVTEEKRFCFGTIAGILTSELTGIILMSLIAAIWNSWLAVLWVCPLFIKLLAAGAALGREHLVLPGSAVKDESSSEPPQHFEVRMPLESGTFLILTGPPSLIYQFFRHYGHPKRSRIRELLQLTLIVAAACLFPVGLVLSVTVMPNAVQYLWTSHQMYLVLTMYICRYMSLTLWASVEAKIAEKLSQNPDGAMLWADQQTKRVVMASVETTVHDRYGEAKAFTERLLTLDNSESALNRQWKELYSTKESTSHLPTTP